MGEPKKMQSADGLDFLFREEELGKDEWVKLIKYQIKSLGAYFNKLTLPELGSLSIGRLFDREKGKYTPRCMGHPLSVMDFNFNNEEERTRRSVSLDTQGIFFSYYPLNYGCELPSERKFWGVTRFGMVIIGVAIIKSTYYQSSEGDFLSSEITTAVRVHDSCVEIMLDFIDEDPVKIFSSLSRVSTNWVRKTRERLEEIERIDRKMDYLDSVVMRLSGFGAFVHE